MVKPVPRTKPQAPIRSFVLSEALCAALDKECQKTGLKQSEVVRRALMAHLK